MIVILRLLLGLLLVLVYLAGAGAIGVEVACGLFSDYLGLRGQV